MQKYISRTTVLILLVTLITACSSKNTNSSGTVAANTDVAETAAVSTAAAVPETKSTETAASSASVQTAPAVSENIDAQAARQIALAAAGVSSEQAVFSKTHLDYDDGKQEWEIEFVAGDSLYEYDINAADGTVLKNSAKSIRSTSGASSSISQDQAKEIALDAFRISSGQATFTKIKLDYDDGLQIWEIEYIAGNSGYEVEINANDGRVLESSSEMLKID